jgi:thiol-disulfide isomerase/thioredoxin
MKSTSSASGYARSSRGLAATALFAIIPLGGLGGLGVVGLCGVGVWCNSAQAMHAAPLSEAQAPASDAAALVRGARAALSEVERLSYNAESEGGGELAAKVPAHRAEVRAARAEVGGWRLALEGTQGESEKFLVGYDGVTVRSIREKDKMVIERTVTDIDALAMFLTSQGCRPAVVWEFLGEEPLQGNDANAKHEGVTTVDGLECDIVLLPTPAMMEKEGVGALRLHIARADSLPRRVERIVRGEAGAAEQTRVLELRGLNVNAKAAAGVYSPAVPDGYRVRATVEPTQIARPPAQTGQPTTERVPVARPPAPTLLAVGSDAPDWTLTDPEGVEHTLSKMRGSVVLMDFWATWCGPCKRVMPGLQRIHEHFEGKPVKVLGINCWERGDPAKYMADQKFTYGLLLKADEVAQQYGVRGIPTFYLIGADGKVLHASVGAHPGEEQAIIKKIEAALEAK